MVGKAGSTEFEAARAGVWDEGRGGGVVIGRAYRIKVKFGQLSKKVVQPSRRGSPCQPELFLVDLV